MSRSSVLLSLLVAVAVGSCLGVFICERHHRHDLDELRRVQANYDDLLDRITSEKCPDHGSPCMFWNQLLREPR